MKPKRLIKSSIAFTLAFTMVITSGIVANASEPNGSEKYTTISENIKDILPKQTEEVKQVNSIEELDTNDTIVKESDSIFKSCRLIIYSDKEMEFDNDYIKSVQKYDNFYVVEYVSVKDTEDSYNDYKEDGIDVEIDEVKDTPEIVENKANKNTEAEEDVSKEEIATTNIDKEKQTVDNAKADKKVITVAVLDSGLNANEDIFTDKIVEGKNFVKKNNNTNDNNGHGSAMSKIILEEVNNDTDTTVKIMPIKVLNDEGSGTTLSTYKGIKYAIEKDVDVINLSLSGLGKSKLLESAINDAVNHNIPVVVSAGNNNKEITEYTPANIESAITVTSSDKLINNDTVIFEKADYSNYGSDTNNVDFTAKGNYEYKRIINEKEVTTTVNGTSVSTAYVTGFIALLKQLALTDEDDSNDNLTFNDIYNSLNLSTTKIDDTNSVYDLGICKSYFGNGYLEKGNFIIQKSEGEITPLPVEEVKETDENITLNAQATNRFMSACIVDGYGFYDSSKGLEAIAAQNACGYARSWEDKNIFLGAILGSYITDYQNHTITFNDALEIDNGGATINLYGTKTINCVDSDGVAGDGIGEKYSTTYNAAVTVNGYITFVGGSISSAGAQDSTNLSFINKNISELNNRPALENNGTVTLNNTGLRAGYNANYVVKNNSGHTMTLTGGGASMGAANASASKPNIINEGTLTISENSTGKYQLDKSYTTSGFQNSEAIRNNGTLYVNEGAIGHATVGIKNNTTNANISGGTIFACSVGIENASNKRLNQSSGSITSNTYGVVNNSGATYIKSGGNIYSNTTGVINNNNATFTQSGGTISNNNSSGVENGGTLSLTNGSINSNNGTGVNNSNTFNMSGGTVNHNIVGINNSKTFNLTNGNIYNNTGYGIDNLSVVKHSGGSIYSNSTTGFKADTTDNCNIGVNQNGTYEMSGSAKVYSNSIYLLSNKLVDLTSSSFNGSAILTTATSDRVVGRELVKTNGAANYTKFSLAYGNDGTKTNAKYVKDSADSGSSSFTGNKALIRPGSSIIGISQSKSAYLSAEYSIKYNKNTSETTSPTSYSDTTFYWKETVAPLFGTNVYTKTSTGVKSIGYSLSSSAKTPTYTTNTTFNTSSTVLKKSTVYYAVWALSYKVHYDYNNGYGGEYTQTCNRDITYNFISKPSNYKKPTITYNYNYDSKTQTINVDKTFNGWLRTGTSTLYQPNSSFNNLGEVNSTVNLVGSWSIKSVTLPTPERDGYEFKGWEEQESGTIYDGGDSYTPADDNPTTFIAIWEEADKYYVNYVHNNGYGDTELKTCNRDKTYQYADAPSRYVSAEITFDYDYDNVKLYQQTPKSFNGWSKVGSSVKYAPGVNFVNLAPKDETITLNGNWTIQPITFPDGERDDYELIGWKIPDDDTVYPVGTTYLPKDDEPITFIAVWKPIDREVIFDPNGAVDTSGNLVSNVSVEKPAPLAAPFTLLEGTDVGGKKLTSDTTYFRGSINSDLVAYIPENNNKSSVQYRAKEGDIINNLGNAGTLAKFMGWSKTSSKSNVVNGTVDLTSSELFGAAAYANKQFTLYAVWDEFPILEAEDVLINDLDTVTQNDLLETVTVNDNEDNNLKSKVTIINYNEAINALKNNASGVSIIYEVTDSAGNTTRAFAIAKEGSVDNSEPLNVITKLVRSIDRHAYNTHDEKLGGCLVNSPWYNNAEYVATINKGFDNMDNNTPIAHYMLTQDERVEISEYIHKIGLQKLHSKELLNYIVANYMDSEHSSKDYEFADKPTNIGYTSTVVTGNALQERYERELDRLKALRNDMDLSRIYR